MDPPGQEVDIVMGHPRVVRETVVPPEHNFKLKWDDWERTVFDAAEQFAVSGYRGRGTRSREVFDDLQAAYDYATRYPRTCVYAFTKTGHHVVLDRGLWGKWMERWKGRTA